MSAPDGYSPSVYIAPRCEQEPQVLYQDDDILVVDKPSGLLSVPGRHPLNNDSLATRLQRTWPGAIIVHRLDMDTSGIMVVGLNKKAHAQLSTQFQYRKVTKIYEAVVSGLVADDDGVIDLPLVTDWPNRPLQKVCFNTGKGAITHYRVISRDAVKATTRLELRPQTGRSHQLRVHCRELGHVILGDRFYAPEDVVKRAPRLMLHACELTFFHPRTDEPLTMTSASRFE